MNVTECMNSYDLYVDSRGMYGLYCCVFLVLLDDLQLEETIVKKNRSSKKSLIAVHISH